MAPNHHRLTTSYDLNTDRRQWDGTGNRHDQALQMRKLRRDGESCCGRYLPAEGRATLPVNTRNQLPWNQVG